MTTTARKNGAWAVELITPIRDLQGKEITTIVIGQLTFDLSIKWSQAKIPSFLALLAILSNVPEQVLRTLVYPDVDRVLKAFFEVLPVAIQNDFTNGVLPIATPQEALPEAERHSLPPDPIDPRFPAADGPVQRFPEGSLPPIVVPDTGSDISLAPPIRTR